MCHIFHVFQFSHHNPGPKVCVSHFARFSLFPAIFQVLPCEFLIFLFGHFFHHNPDPPLVCIPYFPSFSVFFFFFFAIFQVLNCMFLISIVISFLAILQFLQCAFLIFHVFECFWPYSKSNSVCVFQFFSVSHFAIFSVVLAIFHVLPCEFLIFLVWPFSRHIPGPTVSVCVILQVFQ